MRLNGIIVVSFCTLATSFFCHNGFQKPVLSDVNLSTQRVLPSRMKYEMSEMNSNTYPSAPTFRECLTFVIPALGIYLSGPLMTLIDAAFVGRASSVGLAALGPAGRVLLA